MKLISAHLLEGVTTSISLPSIYLDMDETIVEWLPAANHVLNAAGLPSWKDSYWKQFSDGHNDKVRWGAINNVPDFWETLNFSEDGRAIWEFVKQYKPYILSACGPHALHAKPGKMKWISRNLGYTNLSGIHLVRSHEKKDYATLNGKPCVLIDDYIKNCNEFQENGGISIQTTTANSVISQLKNLGFA